MKPCLRSGLQCVQWVYDPPSGHLPCFLNDNWEGHMADTIHNFLPCEVRAITVGKDTWKSLSPPRSVTKTVMHHVMTF